MNDLDRRVHDAFDSLHAPEALKAQTLQAIRSDSDQPKTPAPRIVRRPRKRLVSLAACLALLVALVGGASYLYQDVTAYVDIDVNPSVELSLNCFDRVVDAKAYNDDGEAVLEAVDVRGATYDEAFSRLMEAADTYLTPESYVEVVVSSDDEATQERLCDHLSSLVSGLDSPGSCRGATQEEHSEARDAGMGMGRFEAAQRLMALEPERTLESCAEMSMRELRDAIESHGSEVQGHFPEGGNHRQAHKGA